jgi:hypothetical protein
VAVGAVATVLTLARFSDSTLSDVVQVHNGMTRAEVVRLLGEPEPGPLWRGPEDAGCADVLIYRDQKKNRIFRWLDERITGPHPATIVHFCVGEDGRVVSRSWELIAY